jgi:hypothetical protein
MAFRNPAAALVQVGLAPGRQVIIDPTQAGQITFPNPNGFAPASIGTVSYPGGEELQIHGPGPIPNPNGHGGGLSINDTSAGGGFPRSALYCNKPTASRFTSIIVDPTNGISMQNGESGQLGRPLLIANTEGFANHGTRWLAQVAYFAGLAFTAGVVLTVTLPSTFPTGESGAWGWPSIQGAAGLAPTVDFNGAFPGGAHNQANLVCSQSGTFAVALLMIVLYPE